MMKKPLAALATCAAFCAPTWAATPPIVSVSCSTNVSGCAFAADGSFPAEGQFYQSQTAFWTTSPATVTFALSAPVLITGYEASLDNNDDYRFEWSLNGTTWATLSTVTAGLGEINGGMDTFSTNPASPEFVTGIAFAPTSAAFVRIIGTGGDGLFAVGELTLFTTAVPEASTWLSLTVGLGALGLFVRRRPAAG